MYRSSLYSRTRKTGSHIVKEPHALLHVIGDGYMRKGNSLHVFPKGFRYIIMGDNNDRTPGSGDDCASWHCNVGSTGKESVPT
jgi:hypothetical protein